MFKKIRSTITGYKIRHASLIGLEIRTSYKGKIPSHDPLITLKELKSKLVSSPMAALVNLDFHKSWNERVGYLEGLAPTTVSKFQVESNLYKISRFVTKQKKSPLSIYTFSRNEIIFAIFSRVYDYGSFFTEMENSLILNGSIAKSPRKSNMLYITNDHYSALFDVFGHSQSFFWNDRTELEKCLDAIKL